MRAVIQRVQLAAVSVNGREVARIGPGLLIFLGVGHGDTVDDIDFMVEKTAHLRIFEDDAGKMNLSLENTSRQLLAVSQFTLYADTQKGRRPSFTNAMPPGEANVLYELFCLRCQAFGLDVQKGVFGADMKVSIVNDGPVTLCLDSRQR